MVVKVLSPLVVTSLPILSRTYVFDFNYKNWLFKRNGQLVPLDSSVQSSIDQVFGALRRLRSRTENQWEREKSYFQLNYTKSDYLTASGSIWLHRCDLGIPFNASFTHLDQAINFLEFKGFYLDWESPDNLEIASKYLHSELERQFIIAQGVCKLWNKRSLPIHVLVNGILSIIFFSSYQVSQPASIKFILVSLLFLGVLLIESSLESIFTNAATEEALTLNDRYIDSAIEFYQKVKHRNELLKRLRKSQPSPLESMSRNAENQIARESLEFLLKEKSKRMDKK